MTLTEISEREHRAYNYSREDDPKRNRGCVVGVRREGLLLDVNDRVSRGHGFVRLSQALIRAIATCRYRSRA